MSTNFCLNLESEKKMKWQLLQQGALLIQRQIKKEKYEYHTKIWQPINAKYSDNLKLCRITQLKMLIILFIQIATFEDAYTKCKKMIQTEANTKKYYVIFLCFFLNWFPATTRMLKQVLWRLNSTLHKKGWKSISKDILLKAGNWSFARLGLGQTKAIKGKKVINERILNPID